DGEPVKPRATAPRVGHVLYILVAVLAAIAGFGVVTQFFSLPSGILGGVGSGLWRIKHVSPPAPMPNVIFVDGEGKERTLKDWKGKVVLVNFWATWCPPCRREMPSLNRLQAKLGGKDFAVVAINIDRTGLEAPRRFITAKGFSHIKVYQDKGGRSFSKMQETSLPLTLVLNREGRIIARLSGPAKWDSSEAEAIIRNAISVSNS
ncbi:MAG: TlpA disulfide reductase family protein, partial [Alphaproteobacteria bacterium]